jgi:hypothetical protein
MHVSTAESCSAAGATGEAGPTPRVGRAPDPDPVRKSFTPHSGHPTPNKLNFPETAPQNSQPLTPDELKLQELPSLLLAMHRCAALLQDASHPVLQLWSAHLMSDWRSLDLLVQALEARRMGSP